MSVLIAFSIKNNLYAQGSLSPDYCKEQSIDCSCFSPADMDKLAVGIDKLSTCHIMLAEKQKFIDTSMSINMPKILWWQAPEMIFGGMAVSVSVGLLVGILAKK